MIHRLIADAAASPEREICGLLLGTSDRVDQALPCANVAADPARFFEIDPAALIGAHRAARAGGPRVIGHYHSHPQGTAEPSPRDAAASRGQATFWLIIGNGEARLWTADGKGSFLRQEIDLVEDEIRPD